MANRSGPRDGYDRGRKRQYRREVWSFFRRMCSVPRKLAQCFLMPSIEGDEIETALDAGFSEKNLHVCDSNAAIVATLKRRFPRIKTYGVDAARALRRIADNGIQIHCANLDLCGTVYSTLTVLRELGPALSADGACVAVTFLRGRDVPTSVVPKETRDDCRRLALLAALSQSSGAFVNQFRAFNYSIGPSPMGVVLLECASIGESVPLKDAMRKRSKKTGEHLVKLMLKMELLKARNRKTCAGWNRIVQMFIDGAVEDAENAAEIILSELRTA